MRGSTSVTSWTRKALSLQHGGCPALNLPDGLRAAGARIMGEDLVMGYESKIILGVTSDREHLPGEGRYVRTVATIDLSKTGDGPVHAVIQGAIRSAREVVEPFYVYVDDGDKGVSEDCYGDPIAEVDGAELLAALQSDDPDYRRFALARHILTGWMETHPAYTEPASPGSDWYARPVVLHYGH